MRKKFMICLSLMFILIANKNIFAGIPVINSISPDSGSNNTSTNVTISGENFDSTTKAFIGAGGAYIKSSVDTPGEASGVYVSGNYAYVADWSSGLQVIDKQSAGALCEPINFINDTTLTAVIPDGLIPGKYNIKIVNSSGEDILYNSFTVTNQSPAVSLAASPTSGTAPLIVNFTADASDPDGTIEKYEWDLNGNGDFETETPGNTISYTYNTPGAYYPKVKVTDDDGAIAEDTITITVNQPVSQLIGNIDTNSPGSSNRVDGHDVYLFSLAFGSTPANPDWNPACDFNGDSIINGDDLVILAANFGKKN